MTVDTKIVEGRRELRFESPEQIVVDALALDAGGHRRLGNWTLGQICFHLAQLIDFSIDGFPFSAPIGARLVGRMARGRMLKSGLPCGLPLRGDLAALIPPDVLDAEGLSELRRAVTRLGRESHREASPILGELTREQWDAFHMRHAELHLGFVEPSQKSE